MLEIGDKIISSHRRRNWRTDDRGSEGWRVSGIDDRLPGRSTGSQMAHVRSGPSGAVSADGDSRGTVRSEGCCHAAVTVNEPCGSMVG
jgi:hypothetical protein